MPFVPFAKTTECSNGDYPLITPGKYEVKIVDVIPNATQKGMETWRLHLEIAVGKEKGRLLFDALFFSDAALPRVKLICSRLGLDVSMDRNLEMDELLNKRCMVEVEIEDYTDKEGNKKKRNKIPFAGYECIDDTTGGTINDETLPF